MRVVARGLQAECLQPGQRSFPGMLEMGEQFRAVLPVLPLAEHLVHEAFGELRGCRVGQQLQIDQVLDEIPVTGHDAYPQPRRQRLGETVEVDDAVELVQTGQTRGWSRVTRTVDVVFDDEKVVPLGKLQAAGTQRPARR